LRLEDPLADPHRRCLFDGDFDAVLRPVVRGGESAIGTVD